MTRKTRIAFSLLLVLMLLISASCALIPQKVREIFGIPVGGEASPEVIIVTSTPRTVTSGLTDLKVSPCFYSSGCPDAIDLHELLDSQPMKAYEVKLAYDVQVRVINGWVAIDDETLKENLASIQWIFKVDGVNYYEPDYIFMDNIKTVEDTSGENSGAWLGVTARGFVLDTPITIEVGYTFSEAINDGWMDYPAGYTSTITYTILPQKLDFGVPVAR